MKKLLMLLGFGFTTIIAFSQTTDSTLTAFEGKYTFPSGSIVPEVSIVLDGTTLTMNANIGSSSLERKEGDLFYAVVLAHVLKYRAGLFLSEVLVGHPD